MIRMTAAILAAFVWAGASHAAVLNWSAALAPGNEVPPVVGSSATGSATGTVDTVSRLLSWDIAFSGFDTPVVALHFHLAPPGVPGPVALGISAISGTASPSVGSSVISETDLADLLAGNWYINVHSEAHPPGEIRGQVIVDPIPLPAAGLLSLGALGLLIGLRRSAPA